MTSHGRILYEDSGLLERDMEDGLHGYEEALLNSYTTPFPSHGTKLELMQWAKCGNAARYGGLSPQILQKLYVKNRVHP